MFLGSISLYGNHTGFGVLLLCGMLRNGLRWPGKRSTDIAMLIWDIFLK